MIPKKYQRKLNSWWKGQRVVTTGWLKDGWHTLLPGSVCTVTRKWGGLWLEPELCSLCGIPSIYAKTPYEKLILLDHALVLEKQKAIQRAQDERASAVAWEGRYLILPSDVAVQSRLTTIYLWEKGENRVGCKDTNAGRRRGTA